MMVSDSQTLKFTTILSKKFSLSRLKKDSEVFGVFFCLEKMSNQERSANRAIAGPLGW